MASKRKKPTFNTNKYRILGGVLLMVLAGGFQAPAKASTLFPDPTFTLRTRVVSIGSETPGAGRTFSLSFGRVSPAKVNFNGSNWSPWLEFDGELYGKVRNLWPNDLMRAQMAVVLEVGGLENASPEAPARVETELRFHGTGATFQLPGELYGPLHSLVIWQDGTEQQKKLAASTEQQFNKRFWEILERPGVALPPAARPRLFPIIDTFRSRGNDLGVLREAAEYLPQAGFNVLSISPTTAFMRQELERQGITRTAGAVNHPPGWNLDWELADPQQEIAKLVTRQANMFAAAGYKPKDMSWFSFSDEPGFYVPAQFTPFMKSPVALNRFRNYLKEKGLSPADLGAANWESVMPAGKSAATTLQGKRLFYWTMRFISWDSNRYYSEITKALETAFYPNLPVATNWNNFRGLFYNPGPIHRSGNTPDAAMLHHDWFEFASQRAGTMLWTEDWFGGEYDPQWSYYLARLSSAARQNNLTFGGYIIPRVSDANIGRKVVFMAGSGAKAIKYFTFGPEYTFPSNTYSNVIEKVWPSMIRAHGLIARAEDILWTAQRPRAEAAVFSPMSSQLWDGKGIADATNTYAHRNIADYMGEMYGTYRTFQRANVPLDFVSEVDLSLETLRPYKLLYVTTPNLDLAQAQILQQWVREGGVLVTTPGALAQDRYDEPTDTMQRLFSLQTVPYARRVLGHAFQDKEQNKISAGGTILNTRGPRTTIRSHKGQVLAIFEDGTPALVQQEIGRGHHFHFAFFPALSNGTWGDGGFPLMMDAPGVAGIHPPVTFDPGHSWKGIEAPLLLNKDSACVTFVNWLNIPASNLSAEVRLPFEAKSVESVRKGKIAFQKVQGGISFSLPLEDMDIVKIR